MGNSVQIARFQKQLDETRAAMQAARQHLSDLAKREEKIKAAIHRETLLAIVGAEGAAKYRGFMNAPTEQRLGRVVTIACIRRAYATVSFVRAPERSYDLPLDDLWPGSVPAPERMFLSFGGAK